MLFGYLSCINSNISGVNIGVFNWHGQFETDGAKEEFKGSNDHKKNIVQLNDEA